jgi:phosphonate transport system substrate-binding protein
MKLPAQSGWRVHRIAAGWWVCASFAFAVAGGGPSAADTSPALRIAISENIAGEVNGNDLRAAMQAWAEAVAGQTGVRIEAELCTTAQLVHRVRDHQVDAFSVNILEFTQVAAYADRELVADAGEVPDGHEYLMLVHQSSGIQGLADLRGRSLLWYRNTRTCLATIWLDTLLAAARLGAADAFFGRLESNPKPSRVVLPVFFRQSDACVVTRQAFNIMCDLNPQLAKQLRVLAVSPKLVTSFMAFHKDSPPETKRRFLAAVTELHKTVAGRQALMLFGSTRLVQTDISVLGTSFDLLHAYDRLKGQAAATGQ